MIFYSYLRKVFRVEIIDYSKIKNQIFIQNDSINKNQKFQKVKQYNKERKTYAEKTKRKK